MDPVFISTESKVFTVPGLHPTSNPKSLVTSENVGAFIDAKELKMN